MNDAGPTVGQMSRETRVFRGRRRRRTRMLREGSRAHSGTRVSRWLDYGLRATRGPHAGHRLPQAGTQSADALVPAPHATRNGSTRSRRRLLLARTVDTVVCASSPAAVPVTRARILTSPRTPHRLSWDVPRAAATPSTLRSHSWGEPSPLATGACGALRVAVCSWQRAARGGVPPGVTQGPGLCRAGARRWSISSHSHAQARTRPRPHPRLASRRAAGGHRTRRSGTTRQDGACGTVCVRAVRASLVCVSVRGRPTLLPSSSRSRSRARRTST